MHQLEVGQGERGGQDSEDLRQGKKRLRWTAGAQGSLALNVEAQTLGQCST